MMRSWREHWERAVEFTAFLEGGEKQAESWRYIYDSFRLADRQRRVLAEFVRPMHVLTVAGLWCGDCSAQVPLIQRICEGGEALSHRLLAIEGMEEDFKDRWQVNGGHRVPVVFILSEDFHLGAFWGDRTLSRYRMLRDVRRRLGPDADKKEFYGQVACQSANEDLMQQTADELLDEIERVQLMFQLSPRLTRLAAEAAAR